MAKIKDFKIKQISAKTTYPVRHPVLRKGRPLETCVFKGDDLKTTIHIGVFHKNQIIGVASFMKSRNSLFKETLQYQLRGMAILEDFQGKGLGKLILAYGEKLLKEKDIELIWCNARINAVNFYKNNGYATLGDPFHIPEIGKHFTMYKSIS